MTDSLRSEAANLRQIIPKKKPLPPYSVGRSLNTLRSSAPSSLTVNVLLITVAIVLIYSGVKRVSIVDAALGRVPTGGATASPETSNGRGLPRGLGTFDGHLVSNWIITELKWARHNGWRGHVESGYRNQEQERAAAEHYGLEHYSGGDPSGSNHTKINYPGGAVDVTEPEQLNRVLSAKANRRLTWGGPVIGDPVHFSATGH